MENIYVVGFINDGRNVLLIKKNRPEWQNGKFNGVGGRVKENESPINAMKREAKEETGLLILKWNLLELVEYDNGVKLYVFHAKINNSTLLKYRSLTDEKVSIFNMDFLPGESIEDIKRFIKNLRNKNV
ncbi:hypothetical protein CP985_03265 [Malaciobacter mytili LMG 24559]|uniref:Nudix hydrolase domain-containing protein n=1 Tax=Malaciobacter mytili LMG 24559 TaxID=1032238 RepID=A0AAX2AK33_9BACT|nr:NUDIX domain-containing protein [Malaciobacter mytili]AXH16379.1 Nudix domain-containing protein, MTH1 family [Malaciobacter mytili LMG 24559]RXK16443.1 hypothetical protein CP985_03265 [Malaciobacter mytili LMG 24559]